MSRSIRVLLVEGHAEDALAFREMLVGPLPDRYVLTHAGDLAAARQRLDHETFDVVVVDPDLPDTDRLDALDALRAYTFDVPVIVIAGAGDHTLATKALHVGAQDFVRKSELQPALLSRSIDYAIERQSIRAALRDSQSRLTGIINSAMDGIISIDDSYRIILANPAAEQMFGHRVEQLVGQPLDRLLPPEFRGQHPRFIAEFGRTGISRRAMHTGTVTAVRAGGESFPVEASISQVTVNGRRIYTAILRDVTERRRIEQALQESEATNRALFESLADGVFVAQDYRFVFANPALPRMLRYEPEQFVGLPFREVVAPEFLQVWSDRFARRLGGGPEPPAHYEVQFLDRDGCRLWVELRATRFRWRGQPAVLGILRDVSERHEAEERLRQSEERFRQVTESLSEVVWLTDLEKTRLLYVSPAYETVWGRSLARLHEQPQEWTTAIHPDDRERVLRDQIARQVEGRYEEEYRIIRPDGSLRRIRDRAFPVRDRDGRVVRIAGVAEDVTERRQLEEQLRHTQKMESIGQLAGGVAHDFNNWLTVIFGYTEVLAERLGDDPFGSQALGEIRRAGERASSLTRQLLAFSRKEVLQPRVHDLNVIVRDTEKILRRVLGEDVDAQVRLAPAELKVRVDFSQWVQVLMNLVINARDAMPTGGRITIATDRVDAATAGLHAPAGDPESAGGDGGVAEGPCARLTVSDTGSGMPPDVVARAFEPYFTTKGVGKGTGLGLAVVHGIVEQSRGTITIESEPGVGTSVRMHLPIVSGGESEPGDVTAATHLHGHETILFVEDEASLRRIAVHGLRAQGYTVIEAADGREAIDILRQRGDIDLVLTDVVMPEVGGRQVAETAAALHAGIRVLYMTGYTNDAVVRHGLLDAGIRLLHKPYTPDELYRAVRDVLESP